MKLYIIAGESSGDYIGSRVISSLRKLLKISREDPEHSMQLEIYGIGGPLMQAEGISSLFSIDQINMMGFVEILPHIFRIKRLIDETVTDIVFQKPDILLTIDAPGFTKRIAKEVKQHVPETKIIHMVAPSVWAYKPGRAKEYSTIYDHLFTLLPFEPKYFEKHGLSCTHIGHPIFEQNFYTYSNVLKEEMALPDDYRVIVVTPGSRNGEIKRHMPIIRTAIERLAETNKIIVLFVQNNESKIKLISNYLSNCKFDYRYTTKRLKAFAVADIALAKSGTNTLEINASGTPQIIGYKINFFTFLIIKMMIKIRFACIINIIAGREIIPEYIQSEFTADNIAIALSDILNDLKKGKSQVAEGQKILSSIGLQQVDKPSEIAARKLVEIYRGS